MSAIGKKKKDQTSQQLLDKIGTPEEMLQRRRALESRVVESNVTSSNETELTGLAAEKAVGALCFLPKSLHRLASRAAEDRDLTAKRFFLESLLIGLEQQGVITSEQRAEALKLPNEYGWKGRKESNKDS